LQIGKAVVQGDCAKECTCQGHDEALTCTPLQCRSDQMCRLVDGVKQCACPPLHGDFNGVCMPPGTCRCSGDPHCYSFDGGHFSYQGACWYTMVQDGCVNSLPNTTPNFEVYKPTDWCIIVITLRPLVWVHNFW
jgi:hypothetical protein